MSCKIKFTGYKTNQRDYYDSYADFDLVTALIRSFHDVDMQQWQGFVQAVAELTNNTTWSFDGTNQRISYDAPIALDGNIIPSQPFCWTWSGGSCSISALQDGSATTNINNACDYSYQRYVDTYGADLVSFKSCNIDEDGNASLVWKYYWNSEDSVQTIGKHSNPYYDPNAPTSQTLHVSFIQVAEKIILNSLTTTNEIVQMFAETYIQTVINSIFETDPDKQFVKIDDLYEQLEQNKIIRI